MFYQHCILFQTPLSDAGSLSEGAAAFDVIAAGGPLSIDTGADLGQLCWTMAFACVYFDLWLVRSLMSISFDCPDVLTAAGFAVYLFLGVGEPAKPPLPFNIPTDDGKEML